MPHFEFTGASVITSLKNGIGQSDLALVLNDGSNWPTGAGGKVFTATLGDALSGQAEEKILCSARANENVTIVSRGYDGTAPQSWGPNTRIRHTISGIFAGETSDHMWDDTRDDHSQYHNAARHAAVSHTLGMMGAGSVGTSQLVDDSVTQPKIGPGAVGTTELAAGGVVAGPIPNLGITTALLNDGAVTGPKLADGGISDENKFSAGLSPIIVASSNPGAVGAHRFWFNTTSAKLALLKRNAADTGWEVVQGMVGVNYTPTLYNFGVDGTNGVNVARYNRKGDLIIVNGYIELGGVGAFISGRMGVGLPVLAKDLSATFTAGFYGHGATRALDNSAAQVWAGVGLVGHNATFAARDRLDFIGTGGSGDWNATIPFAWNGTSGDRFSWFAEYEPASLEDANYV